MVFRRSLEGNRGLPVLALLGIVCIASSAAANAPRPPVSPGAVPESAVPGELIVQLSEEAFASAASTAGLGKAAAEGRTGIPEIDARLASVGATAIEPVFDTAGDPAGKKRSGLDRILLVRFDPSVDPAAAARALEGTSGVVFAEPNGIVRALFMASDPSFPAQWAHNNTGQATRYGGGAVGTPDCDTDTPGAWDIETGSSSVIVAVLDTGVDLGHPEFAGRIVPGYDFVNSDTNPSDDHGHGTACAGIAVGAGNNGQGIAGVAWGVKLMPVKVLNASGTGTNLAAARGITFAANNGAKILSISFGGPISSTLMSAVYFAVNVKGCALFCASGNANTGTLDYPAGFAGTVAVGALSPCDQRKNTTSCDGEWWWGSNYGTGLDFLAPGVRIHTTDVRGAAGLGSGDYVTEFNGTSAAAPHAAGVAALVLSANPALTNAEIRALLDGTCDDLGAAGYDTQTGYGRLNAYRAVQEASGEVGGDDGDGDAPVTLLSETFETNGVPGSTWSSGDLNASSGLDYWGDETAGDGARVHGGSRSAYCARNTDLAGQAYDNNMNAHVTLSSSIDLSGYADVQLSFWKWHNTYNASDYLSFQYWNGTSWAEQQRWSGASAAWTNATFSISGLSSLKFRFIFYSSGINTAEGAYLDDIVVTAVPSVDNPLKSGGPVVVRLVKEVAEDGTVIARGEDARSIDPDGLDLPAAMRPILEIVPNPSTAPPALRFSLPAAAAVRLDVYSVEGRRVAVLADGALGAGPHEMSWNLRDERSRAVGAGVYFARLLVDGRASVVEKIVLVR